MNHDAELRDGLARLRSETASPEIYAHVRGQVMRELERKRRIWWAWPVAIAFAAALIALVTVEMRPGPIAGPPTIARLPSVPPVSPLAVAPRRHRVKPPAAEPLTVRMLTDDPQVVIYWITAGNGE